MFQVIKISFRNPDTGEEIKDVHFLGPAAFSKEDFERIKHHNLGDVVTGLVIGAPEDPMKYADTNPEIKDLMDSMADLREELGSKTT